MSGFEFAARLVASLAWPLVTLVGILILRHPIVALLSGPLRRMKVGPVEAEWEQIVERTELQVRPHGAPSDPAVGVDLDPEAELVPKVAILEAYGRLEEELRRILASSGEASPDRGAVQMAHLARDKGLISPQSLRAVEGVSMLRNLVAHDAAGEVTTAKAREYLTLIDANLYALRVWSGETREAQHTDGSGSGSGRGSGRAPGTAPETGHP
jgi:hypothetical protein